MQDSWYQKKTEKYGLPLDSRHTYTKSDWEMFIAAISKPKTRNLIIDRLATWINETSTGSLPLFTTGRLTLGKTVRLQICMTPLELGVIQGLPLSIGLL